MLNKWVYGLVFIFNVLSITSCLQKSLNKKELIDFINDEKNGLVISKEFNGLNIKMSYIPRSLIYNELNSKTHFEYFRMDLSEDQKNIESLIYIKSKGDPKFYDIINFRLNEYVNIVRKSGESIQSKTVFRNPLGNIKNYSSFTFVFDSLIINPNEEYFDIYINEFGLGIGTQSFRFKVNSILVTPKLNK